MKKDKEKKQIEEKEEDISLLGLLLVLGIPFLFLGFVFKFLPDQETFGQMSNVFLIISYVVLGLAALVFIFNSSVKLYNLFKSRAIDKNKIIWAGLGILIVGWVFIDTFGLSISSISYGNSASTNSTSKGFKAVLTCEMMGNHTNIVSCFEDTVMELRNGKEYGMYNNLTIQGFGQSVNGVQIDLKPSFALKAQNSSDFLLLTVRIYDAETKELLFQKSAQQYGVISISN